MKLELKARISRFFAYPFSQERRFIDPKTGILEGKTVFSFDEFNICQFCLKKNPNELSVWPCQFCSADYPALYWFHPDFMTEDQFKEVIRINGPRVFDKRRAGKTRRMIREDKSSSIGLGSMDAKQGEFKKGVHSGMPCVMVVIQYWAIIERLNCSL